MPRSIEGHGLVNVNRPPPLSTRRPWPSRISAEIPGNGSVAEPGFVAVMPGKGVIMIIPVSVCHQVSTIGQFSRPIVLWYQIHASGLIGSPTEPRRRNELKSRRLGHSV